MLDVIRPGVLPKRGTSVSSTFPWHCNGRLRGTCLRQALLPLFFSALKQAITRHAQPLQAENSLKLGMSNPRVGKPPDRKLVSFGSLVPSPTPPQILDSLSSHFRGGPRFDATEIK